MKLDIRSDGGIFVAKPLGEHLDFETVGIFRREIESVGGSGNKVVLDMSELQFVDSSGLGALLSLLRRLSSEGGDLRLAGVTPSVAALLQLVRLDQIIGMYESSDEAIRSFR